MKNELITNRYQQQNVKQQIKNNIIQDKNVNKINRLRQLFKQQNISNYRQSQLTMLLIGYSISYLQSLSQSYQSNLNYQSDINEINILELINQILTKINSYNIPKKQILILFVKVLEIITKINFNKQTINISQKSFNNEAKSLNKSLNLKKICDKFNDLISYGLQIISNFQQQSINLSQQQLQVFLYQQLKSLIQYSQQGNKERQDQISQRQFSVNQKQITSINIVTQSPDNEPIKSCQICLLPISYNSLQLGPQTVYKLKQCSHQYHSQCLTLMIQNYIYHNNTVLHLSNLIHHNQSIKNNSIQIHSNLNNLNQTLTLIKCPQFDNCNSHIPLSQIHQILSNFPQNNQNQKLSLSTSLLSRVYQTTFNDYINSLNIMPFNQIPKYLSTINKSSNLQNQISYPKQLLFFCHTSGCNAIYQIQTQFIINLIYNKLQCIQLSNFICISCNKSFCLKCCSPLHSNMSCKQYAISTNYLPQDIQLQKFIKTLRRPYMKCPNCKFYVDNWRGCGKMTCRCGTIFCFKCGSTTCPKSKHADSKCIKQIQKQQRQNQMMMQKQQQLKNKHQKDL